MAGIIIQKHAGRNRIRADRRRQIDGFMRAGTQGKFIPHAAEDISSFSGIVPEMQGDTDLRNLPQELVSFCAAHTVQIYSGNALLQGRSEHDFSVSGLQKLPLRRRSAVLHLARSKHVLTEGKRLLRPDPLEAGHLQTSGRHKHGNIILGIARQAVFGRSRCRKSACQQQDAPHCSFHFIRLLF